MIGSRTPILPGLTHYAWSLLLTFIPLTELSSTLNFFSFTKDLSYHFNGMTIRTRVELNNTKLLDGYMNVQNTVTISEFTPKLTFVT